MLNHRAVLESVGGEAKLVLVLLATDVGLVRIILFAHLVSKMTELQRVLVADRGQRRKDGGVSKSEAACCPDNLLLLTVKLSLRAIETRSN